MKHRTKKPAQKREEPQMRTASFSAEVDLLDLAKDRAKAMDLDFSKYMRRLVRKDLGKLAA